MPKSQFVDPNEIRKSGEIVLDRIPVNQYSKSISDEKKIFSKADFLRIYRDMLFIRKFENMFNDVKTLGNYQGIPCDYLGPAHLSIGQEASAVGQAYLLSKDDYILGSHRSHGEIIAKGLSAIEKLDESQLLEIMEKYENGKILSLVKNENDVRKTAINFLLYGILSEIFARENGFNKGLGGSMHVFFPPFGIYPNNAIVGGSADIAVGAALYKKINRKDGIVIANLGDGSMGCGPVWEALNMAAMDQYNLLWNEEYKGGLPIIFNVFSNQYSMGDQPCGETMGFKMPARIGAAINPMQMHTERIDGYNPLAVIDAYQRKMKLLKEKQGPVFLDILTYRVAGHSPSDPSSYRTKEEIDAWRKHDCIENFKTKLIKHDIASSLDFNHIDDEVEDFILSSYKLASDKTVSPVMNIIDNPLALESLMFSNQKKEITEKGRCEVLIAKNENSRVKRIKQKIRHGIKDGKLVPKNKVFQLRDGIFEALIDKFYQDPTMIAYGEGNRDWGGAFAVYRGLIESIPYHRLFNAPISEAAIAGSAVGYAMSGGRVVVELMYCDFLGRAGDEIFNQLSKWQAMSAGILKMPVIVRVSVGSKYGAQHSQEWTSMVAHIPGLKVVYPVTPYDAKGLMNSALSGTDPVIFFESQKTYDIGELFHKEGVPENYYEIQIGEPDIKKSGSDITILTIGATLYRALEAAEILEDKYGISAEVIDARSIVPFDYDIVVNSVVKTGNIVIVGDACERGSFMNDFARNIGELAFDYLDAPPVVIGAKNWVTPALELEDHFFPQADWILDAIHEKMVRLDGHLPNNNMTLEEQIRKSRLGV